ncbi:MAG: hypothetical protein Kow0037_12140 [Calditrichia bacterium]
MSIIRRDITEHYEDSEQQNSQVSKEELIRRLQENHQENDGRKETAYEDVFYKPLSLFDKLNARQVLSIDIETDRIYYISGKKVKNRFQILKWGVEDLTGDEADRYRSIEIALSYIKSYVYKNGMDVCVGFFSPDINIRQVILPRLKPAELHKTILYKNKTDLPHFDESMVWHYEILEQFKENDADKLRALVTVIPREVIDIHLELFKRAGLKIDMLVPRPYAIWSLYNHMVKNKGNDVVVDIGTDTTEVAFFMDGKLRFVRNFAIGANNLQKAIQNGDGELVEWEKNNSPEESENKPETEAQSSIRERLLKRVQHLKSKHNPILQVLHSEIVRSLEFFRGPKNEYPISRIYLSGPGAKLEAVLPFLKNRIRHPLVMIAPKFSQDQKVFNEVVEYGSVLGIALLNNKKLNMLPEEFRTRELFKKLNISAILVVLILCGFMIYHTFLKYEEVDAFKRTIANIEEQYLKMNPVETNFRQTSQKINEVQAEIEKLKQPLKYHPELLQTLKLFSNEVPPDIRLTMLSFKPYGATSLRSRPQKTTGQSEEKYRYAVFLAGQISSDYLMGDVILINFINHLQDLKFFKKIRLLTKHKDPEEQTFAFQIEAYL